MCFLQVDLHVIDEFAEKVKDFFKAAILKTYPEKDYMGSLTPEDEGEKTTLFTSLFKLI